MGQTPTEIELDVERQRNALTARAARLRRRVGEDMETTRARTSGHVSGLKHSVVSTGEHAASRVGNLAATTAGSGTTVAEHPKSLVAAAAAGGLALGLLAGGDSAETEPRKRTSGTESPGLVRALTDGARGLVAAKVANLVESAVGGATSSLKSAVSRKEDSAADHSPNGDSSPVHVARPPQLGRGEPTPGYQRSSGEPLGAALDPFTA